MARPRSKTAQTKMLESTREIIVERGVSACTVEEVAARSGVAKTTIYRHYGGLDEMIFAAVGQEVSTSEAPNTGSLRQDLIEIQGQYVEVARSPRVRELFVWMMARAVEDPSHSERFRRVRFQPRGKTVIALQQAMARGELDPTTDIDMAMHVIQGPFISQRIVDNSDITPEELASLVDTAIRALAGLGDPQAT